MAMADIEHGDAAREIDERAAFRIQISVFLARAAKTGWRGATPRGTAWARRRASSQVIAMVPRK